MKLFFNVIDLTEINIAPPPILFWLKTKTQKEL